MTCASMPRALSQRASQKPMRKLDLSSSAELVRYAIRNKLVEPCVQGLRPIKREEPLVEG